ncbi:unnamed protein product [Durusdinium trenchii]|uniref:Uncharacterized protein n=1 Tax=Durusdinium trenchii TaxID=1381693 RepID=A0ABP0ILQ9_9DINO
MAQSAPVETPSPTAPAMAPATVPAVTAVAPVPTATPTPTATPSAPPGTPAAPPGTPVAPAGSPDASQGLPTPVTSGCGDASTAQPMPAALAMAAKAVAPLEQVQRIFAERSKELNTALGEMEVKVNSLMRTPEKSPQLSWEHRCAVAVGERSGEGADSANLREHACWLWSRLGLSLMSLEDRNAMLEEENKRLEQDLELLEQQIRETKSAIKGHSSASSHTPHPRAPPPLDTDEVLSSPMEASALTTPTQSTTSPKNATAAASAHRAPAPASSANVTTPPTSVPSSISAPALGARTVS